MDISLLDTIIIITYLIGTLSIGIFLARKEGVESYFVNNRNTKLFFLIFTSLSTSVGAGTVLGVASASFTTGISFGIMFMIVSILGWSLMSYLAPRIKEFGDKTGAYTFGDYLAYQYSESTRKISRIVIIVAYFFSTAIQFVAFAQLINVATNLNFTLSLLIVAFVTITYTALSGVKGDFFTDAIQFFIMLPVFIFLFIKGFNVIGLENFLNVPIEFISIFNYNGAVFFIAGIIFGFPLILTSVDAWQRAFAANSKKTAQTAFWISGLLKVLVIGAALVIGILAYHLVPGAEQDAAMFTLMKEILPTGLLGLGLASILAIIMSTVDTGILVGSATITKDFYLVKKPKASEKDILKVGRITSLLFGVGGLIVAYFVQDIVVLAIISVQVLLIFSPSLIGGLVWNIKNKNAAFWSITSGFIVSLLVFPFNHNMAFIPGVIISIIVYLIPLLHKNKKHY